ncbi:hypothetical protein M8818_004825 [Zalaria obscura]|uniref:Uncharacterized protein n=1 Tax=Zalaria obscura TaxID=2024903 RepID=A0ACC3SAP0_9PEZI
MVSKVFSVPELFSAAAQAMPSLDPSDLSRYPEPQDLDSDLSCSELNAVHSSLWLAGSLSNISPLHHQRVLLRTIIPTDVGRLHLVWHDHTIYIKPMPLCLLDHTYIQNVVCKDRNLHGLVVGFLHSYTALVRSRLNLRIAQELGLLPAEVTWRKWYEYRTSILQHIEAVRHFAKKSQYQINPRYQYGELRLRRLNLIWLLHGKGLTYFNVHRTYESYFSQYFSLFIAAFAIVATVLTAMQVIVGISGASQKLVNVSYWFAIAALFLIAACLLYVTIIFVALFVWNFTAAFVKSRLRRIECEV